MHVAQKCVAVLGQRHAQTGPDEGQREHPKVGAAPHLPARPPQQLRCSYGGWTGIFLVSG